MALRCPKCKAAIADAQQTKCAACGLERASPPPAAVSAEVVELEPVDEDLDAEDLVEELRSTDFPEHPGFVVLNVPEVDAGPPPGVVGTTENGVHQPAPEQAVYTGSPRDLYRGSQMLVHPAYHKRLSRMNIQKWSVWLDLTHEARTLPLPRRLPHLQLALESSPTIDGWGALRVVEALRGEVKPETPPPSGYLGAGIGTQQATPTTVVVQNGQAQAVEAPRKEGLLGRFRRR